MGEGDGSGGALESARRALAERDADLADADRELADLVAGARELAAASTARIAAIEAEIETVAGQPTDHPAGVREASRQLVAKTREVASLVSESKAAAEAKALAMKQLMARYQPGSPH